MLYNFWDLITSPDTILAVLLGLVSLFVGYKLPFLKLQVVAIILMVGFSIMFLNEPTVLYGIGMIVSAGYCGGTVLAYIVDSDKIK